MIVERYGKDIPIDIQVLSEKNKRYLYRFSCGNESIDEYFNFYADSDPSAVTYLFLDKEQEKLISCMTISCSAIFIKEKEPVFSTILSAMEIKYFAADPFFMIIIQAQQKKSKKTL